MRAASVAISVESSPPLRKMPSGTSEIIRPRSERSSSTSVSAITSMWSTACEPNVGGRQ